ncbi:MAG: hypothetical protein GX235_06325 [Clostridiales bacterium]|nr:hypothetical protein [Clostridiales bacterium]
MRENLMRFMQGRYGSYGPDSLNRFLLAGALVAMIVSLFTRWNFLYGIALVILIYSYFRMLSRNYTRRYAENQMFLKYTAGIRGFIMKQKNVMNQRKTHHIYKCPGCKQKIRVPKGKGKIAIRCPKCSTEFIKKS